jgi:hypothetical protein
MPRKPSKMQDGPRPHVKAAAVAPNPNPAHPAREYPYDPYYAKVPGDGADGAADALLRLDVSTAAAKNAPPPQTEVPAPPHSPLEASSSASAAVGGRREEEALRRLQELAGIGPEKVELTEDEARANDLRQDDEVMRRFLKLSLAAIRELFGTAFAKHDRVAWLPRKNKISAIGSSCHGYDDLFAQPEKLRPSRAAFRSLYIVILVSPI